MLKHESVTKDKAIDFAVDGVLHYPNIYPGTTLCLLLLSVDQLKAP